MTYNKQNRIETSAFQHTQFHAFSYDRQNIHTELSFKTTRHSSNYKSANNVTMQTFFIAVKPLLLLSFTFVLKLVGLLVDCLKHCLRHLVLPPLRYHKRKVLVQVLVCISQLQHITHQMISILPNNIEVCNCTENSDIARHKDIYQHCFAAAPQLVQKWFHSSRDNQILLIELI